MRRVAKSRGAPRVVAAAHKSSDDATTNVEAEKHQPNANAVAGVAAAAAILGNTDAAMANAYDDYVKALEAQNIAPASIEVVPPGEAPVVKAAPVKTAPAPEAAKAPKVDREAAKAKKAAAHAAEFEAAAAAKAEKAAAAKAEKEAAAAKAAAAKAELPPPPRLIRTPPQGREGGCRRQG